MTDSSSNNPYRVTGSQQEGPTVVNVTSSKPPGPITLFVVAVLACIGGLIAFVFTCFGVGLAGVSVAQNGDPGYVFILAIAVGIIAAVVVVRLIFRSYIPIVPASVSASSLDDSERDEQGLHT